MYKREASFETKNFKRNKMLKKEENRVAELNKSTIGISDLPPEIIANIVKYLDFNSYITLIKAVYNTKTNYHHAMNLTEIFRPVNDQYTFVVETPCVARKRRRESKEPEFFILTMHC
ncbi:hypothetical protein [Perigonia lusca single nucleopolyhedrovirus]|uniref:F-box domain-containing protein n=1 Tax=Perigonia lusca single nucleopolyhedrovirus TaxID=1675865 RepID=A0A0M3WNJ8_9ABAC|nr:hypothetical protein [Perigonia lusca single nucleopolyhedrovirus]AKN80595.1 hypothetical protein [Perigonia lusca single nucleopolyhedrovirus]